MELVFFFTVTLIAILSIVVNLLIQKNHSETTRLMDKNKSMLVLEMSDKLVYSLRESMKRQKELEELAFIEQKERRTYLNLAEKRIEAMKERQAPSAENPFPPSFFAPSPMQTPEEETYLSNRRMMGYEPFEQEDGSQEH